MHSQLVSRFQSLNGQGRLDQDTDQGANGNAFALTADDEGKTIEELLAEIGPEDSWNLPKDEATQVDALLKAAQDTLTAGKQREAEDAEDVDANDVKHNHLDPNQYIQQDQEPTEEELDRDANEYLAQVLDELKHQSPEARGHEGDIDDAGAGEDSVSNDKLAMPVAPDRDPDPPSYTDVTADDELASRFANLNLPAVPQTAPTTTMKPTPKQPTKGYTDDEIDSWCVICNEDATLICPGCDGDLYCTNCWLDGHKGPDAGYEERTHRAKQYVKRGSDVRTDKRLVGA